MKLYLLINEFKYSDPADDPDRVGIFDSLEAVEQGKKDFMDSMPTLPHDLFKFYVEEFELNKLH